MKISHFRHIVEHPVATNAQLSVVLKNGSSIVGDWSWVKGPGEFIMFGQKGEGSLPNYEFLEIEEIASVRLNREGVKS